MTDEHPSEVLGGLPRTRPHRRSDKRRPPTEATAARPVTAPPTPALTDAGGPDPGAPLRPELATPGPAAPGRPKPATPRRAKPAATHTTPAAAPGATKRATRSPSSVRQPAQPAGAPPAPQARRPAPTGGVDLLGSAVHVTAELAEMGISAGARALRGVVARLPRP